MSKVRVSYNYQDVNDDEKNAIKRILGNILNMYYLKLHNFEVYSKYYNRFI